MGRDAAAQRATEDIVLYAALLEAQGLLGCLLLLLATFVLLRLRL